MKLVANLDRVSYFGAEIFADTDISVPAMVAAAAAFVSQRDATAAVPPALPPAAHSEELSSPQLSGGQVALIVFLSVFGAATLIVIVYCLWKCGCAKMTAEGSMSTRKMSGLPPDFLGTNKPANESTPLSLAADPHVSSASGGPLADDEIAS